MSELNVSGKIIVRTKMKGTKGLVESDMGNILMDGCLYLANKYKKLGFEFDTTDPVTNQTLKEMTQ